MKNIYLNAGTINDVFAELATAFNGVLHSDNNESKLTIDTGLIKGNIDGVTFINGITSIQATVTFSDDTILSMEPLSKSSVLFAYCTEGNLEHSFGIAGRKSTLRKHHSAVVSGSRNINTILRFKKNTAVQLSIIKVETAGSAHAIKGSLISKLENSFLNKQQNQIHQGILNLKIAEKLKQLDSVTGQGMIGHIKKKEIIQSILNMEIDDNTDNLIKISRAIRRRTLNQINELKKISDFIKEYAAETIYSKIGL